MKDPAPRRAATGPQIESFKTILPRVTVQELVFRTRLSDIVRELGGPEMKRGRCAAWYRGGKSPTSLAINDDRGTWYDFGIGQGGGVLDLIETVVGCTRREAAEWLSEFHGTTLGRQTPAQARRWRQRAGRAGSAAADLERFRTQYGRFLRAVRNFIWDECRLLDRWADEQSECTDDRLWIEVAKVPERMRIADSIDEYVALLDQMGARELISLRKRLEGGSACRAA